MKFQKWAVISIVMLILIGCGCSNKYGQGQTGERHNCEGITLAYMEGSSNYSSEKTYKFATDLSAISKKITDLIAKDDTSGLSALTASIDGIGKTSGNTKSVVSQQFYQDALAYRIRVCDLERFAEKGYLNSRVFRTEFEKFSNTFEGIKKEEKKNIIKSIKVNPEKVKLKPGGTRILNFKAYDINRQILPEIVPEWTSSNNQTVTVENGNLFAHKAGEAIVTAQVHNLYAKSKIRVIEETCWEIVESWSPWESKSFSFNQEYFDAGLNYHAGGDGEIEVYLKEHPKNKAGSVTIFVNNAQAIARRFDTRFGRELSLHHYVSKGDKWQVAINIDSVEQPSTGPESSRKLTTNVKYKEKRTRRVRVPCPN